MADRSKHPDSIEVIFENEGDFQAYYAAQAWLQSRGFSCGRGQRGAPNGILFGEYEISKWKNLSFSQRQMCDGVLVGDHRHGPISVVIYGDARDGALAAARADLSNKPNGGVYD